MLEFLGAGLERHRPTLTGCIRAYGLCFAALLMLSQAACSGLATIPSDTAETPEVSLAGLRYAEPGLAEQNLTIELRIKNPNDFDIPVDSLNFVLDVNEVSFARGLTERNFTLPSLGETKIPIVISIPTGELMERVAALGTERRLDYKLTGKAEIDSWFTRPVPFIREGKLALPKFPGLDDGTSNIDKAS